MKYQIGEFSKITSLTIKALRYYDEEGILKPSYRAENGYRFYQEEDVKKAEKIILLKELQFSISEMKDILENESQIQYYMKEKREKMMDSIKKEREKVRKLDAYLKNIPEEKKAIKQCYEVIIKEYPPITALTYRFQGAYDEVGKYVRALYKDAKSFAVGNWFNCYYDNGYQEISDIELCLPIKKTSFETKFKIKYYPKIRAISTIHIGCYQEIGMAYKAIFDEAKRQNLVLTGPARIIYHKGPGMVLKGNPNYYQTEVIVPIREER